MKRALLVSAGVLAFLFCAAAYADDRPDEGRITSIDATAQVIVVQGENGDQFDLYWTESTKVEGKATLAQFKPGDYVHFDYVEKEGRKFLTEIRRSSGAKD